jgi:hypothetical protein
VSAAYAQLSLLESTDEEWRPVISYDGYYADVYEVSNRGRVRRKDATCRYPAGYLLTLLLPPGKYRYYHVMLTYRGKQALPFVHKLVCEAFHGPRPPGHFVNHIDADKLNNDAVNLEWTTPLENTRHAVRLGLLANRDIMGEKSGKSKLTNIQVREIRMMAGTMSPAKIGKRYGVSGSTVDSIIKRKAWRHLD